MHLYSNSSQVVILGRRSAFRGMAPSSGFYQVLAYN